jgi:hypothetical protein
MNYSLGNMLGGASVLNRFDPDAKAYIAAVETADGQALEPAIRNAYDVFVRGCKSDGIWDAIKASCILSGARSLSGALVPLKGSAPTNNNFVSGDYVRTTGLVGDGTTKYLNSNRNNNADPQNSKHFSIYATTIGPNTADMAHIGASTALSSSLGTMQLINVLGDSRVFTRLCDSTTRASSGSLRSTGFAGASRSNSSNYSLRAAAVGETSATSSLSLFSANVFVFARNLDGVANLHSDARIAFYSIGESLDLAALDARVTTLTSAITAALP